MPILFLLSGPKWVFRPAGAARCPDKREIWPLPRAKFHVYRSRSVGIHRGGATVLKVGGQVCERSEQKIFFNPPPLFGQRGGTNIA